ncbi:unnamed protein product [Echinostoma caproni]|uniref:Uncharacterized protein n=1 Tax=Echinostoma caproni TaxID=27848 RepID=A0A183AZ20_9TREM|nr:unnamed protein product [Echinostoma caproni]
MIVLILLKPPIQCPVCGRTLSFLPTATAFESIRTTEEPDSGKDFMVESSHVSLRPAELFSVASARTDSTARMPNVHDSPNHTTVLPFIETVEEATSLQDTNKYGQELSTSHINDRIPSGLAARSTDASVVSQTLTDKLSQPPKESEPVNEWIPLLQIADNLLKKPGPQKGFRKPPTTKHSSVDTAPVVPIKQDIYRGLQRDPLNTIAEQPFESSHHVPSSIVPIPIVISDSVGDFLDKPKQCLQENSLARSIESDRLTTFGVSTAYATDPFSDYVSERPDSTVVPPDKVVPVQKEPGSYSTIGGVTTPRTFPPESANEPQQTVETETTIAVSAVKRRRLAPVGLNPVQSE